jgi:hypothetical protein
MDRRYIRDNQLIERYLRGTLTPDEEQAFEEAYVGDPELLAELELADRLRQGVKELGAGGELKRRPLGGSRFSAPFSRAWAAAASVLVVVSLAISAGLYRDNASLRQDLETVADVEVRLLPLMTLRGAPESEIEAPREDELAVLLVDPGFTSYDVYRAVVSRRSDQSSAEIWAVEGLRPEFQDQLVVEMPGRLLPPGRYEIEVTGRMNDWPADRAETVNRTAISVVAASDQR